MVNVKKCGAKWIGECSKNHVDRLWHDLLHKRLHSSGVLERRMKTKDTLVCLCRRSENIDQTKQKKKREKRLSSREEGEKCNPMDHTLAHISKRPCNNAIKNSTSQDSFLFVSISSGVAVNELRAFSLLAHKCPYATQWKWKERKNNLVDKT